MAEKESGFRLFVSAKSSASDRSTGRLDERDAAIILPLMKQDRQIDAVDRKIIAALQEDATLSHAELAERVGASSASCWRRIKALEAAGVLAGTVRLVDPEKVGRGVNVLCNIRMRSHAQEARRAFEQFVEGRPEIVECFSMSGEWDYLMRIVVADVADYNRFLMMTLLGHPSVAGAASHFALSMTKFTTALPV
ncbi:putative transcriptional regulator protein [Sphingobium fuliginis]|nr:putative transcriptional regulator protein [Sphingobium fuliginis]